jgi:hypothetical protein
LFIPKPIPAKPPKLDLDLDLLPPGLAACPRFNSTTTGISKANELELVPASDLKENPSPKCVPIDKVVEERLKVIKLILGEYIIPEDEANELMYADPPNE